MSNLQIIRSLAEDMNAIGLDGVDPHIAGLPISEDADDSDADTGVDEGDEAVEPYSLAVQEAAMEIFQVARPQIDESLIDYEESEFNYDFLNSIAALIESAIEDGSDLEDAAQAVAETVSSTYNRVTVRVRAGSRDADARPGSARSGRPGPVGRRFWVSAAACVLGPRVAR